MGEMIYVGVDLHKTQFTVCVLIDDQEVGITAKYDTGREGYESFISRMQILAAEYGRDISIAVESTANARYFREVMEDNGFLCPL